MNCPRCDAAVDEQALLCPQCGNALIEQKSKAQLAREAYALRGRSKVTLALAALVVFAGLVAVTALLGGGDPMILLVALALLAAFAAVAVPVGLGLGYLIYRIRTPRARPRVRPTEGEQTSGRTP
jgi:hypothetical protein